MTGQLDNGWERRIDRRPGLDRETLGPRWADWRDEHRLILAAEAADGGQPLVVALAVGLHLQPRATVFRCAVFGDGEPMVVSVTDGPIPAHGWELRTSGLWADHVCEQPYEHWSYGLEAFALAIDDPAELLGRGLGHRVPLGWELELEAEPSDVVVDVEPTVEAGAYTQLGWGHGLLLTATGEQEIEGRAVRTHRWGLGADRPSQSVLAAGPGSDPGPAPAAGLGAEPEVEVPAVALPGIDEVWWVERTPAGARDRTDPR